MTAATCSPAWTRWAAAAAPDGQRGVHPCSWRPACPECSRPATYGTAPSNEWRLRLEREPPPFILSTTTSARTSRWRGDRHILGAHFRPGRTAASGLSGVRVVVQMRIPGDPRHAADWQNVGVERLREAVYGTIILISVLAVLSEKEPSALDAGLSVAGTAVVLFLAHVYAGFVAERIGIGRETGRASRLRLASEGCPG